MRRMACLLGMLTCAACGDAGEAPAAIAEVIDSAGVMIVTSEPGDAVYAEVAEEPTLSLGALDGPEELLFGRIASVARDEEGNLVVADNGAGEIRIFGTGGGHLRSFGSRGEGPGEFQSLVGAWPVADGSIVAADQQQKAHHEVRCRWLLDRLGDVVRPGRPGCPHTDWTRGLGGVSEPVQGLQHAGDG